MKTKQEMVELIDFAREQGMRKIEIDGVTFYTEQFESLVRSDVPDVAADEIVKPLSAFDDLSEDEILFWSSPYYDDMQADKEARKHKELGD